MNDTQFEKYLEQFSREPSSVLRKKIFHSHHNISMRLYLSVAIVVALVYFTNFTANPEKPQVLQVSKSDKITSQYLKRYAVSNSAEDLDKMLMELSPQLLKQDAQVPLSDFVKIP